MYRSDSMPSKLRKLIIPPEIATTSAAMAAKCLLGITRRAEIGKINLHSEGILG